MDRRQPLPRLWLMTDERQGEGLWRALEMLPRGAGIVFRHYGLPERDRRARFEKVRRVARRRRLMLLLAGGGGRWRADGRHGGRGPGIRSASAHTLGEVRAAEQAGAHLLFVSPVFATRSHPGARTLGRVRLGLLARQTRLPVIALGGMDADRARTLRGLGIYGWAGIDAWSA